LLNKLTLAVLIAVIAACLVAATGWRTLNNPMTIPDSGATLDIPLGTPLSRVTDELAGRGLLESPWLLTLYARLRGDAKRIHAGEYLITNNTSARELLGQLVAGDVVLHTLTVIEGWRFVDFLAALRQHPAIVPGDDDADAIMQKIGAAGTHAEGQFFPDTYTFPRGTSDLDVLKQAHAALKVELTAHWETRQTNTLTNPYEALILASIVEKETALGNERHRIAGVFTRRLERGMRLQTDPTVIYGLGIEYDGNLRRVDLDTDTPYNTYTRTGLPPTPIALASRAALQAAVAPAYGDSLYFVATGEPDGSHYFSSSLAEHNQAVARYLDRLRNPPSPGATVPDAE
jgi:UPF0755 protein